MTLRLAPGLTLPDEAVTQTFGILAKRGAGKTNAGVVMAEEMHKAGLPFAVVDPVGAWWGLRSSGDGKGAGLSIPIFGGYHGDVPLEPGSGRLIADLIVGENLSTVLDVSNFDSEGAKRRWLGEFATHLYQIKGKPGNDTPLHLFLEEADDYVPQKANRDNSVALGAFERIVKRGRARGLGATMITQRSASLNKDVLTQIETLIVLRTVSPQDRGAIGLWVKFHGQAEEILATIGELDPGEVWFWSMWLDKTKRVQMRRRRTFDSGATPDVKAKRAVATLADVDIGAITEQMSATIERAKADDPAELRKQLAAAQREIADLSLRLDNQAMVPVVETVEVPVERFLPVIDSAFRNEFTAFVDKVEDRLAIDDDIRELLMSRGDQPFSVDPLKTSPASPDPGGKPTAVGGGSSLGAPARPVGTGTAPVRAPASTLPHNPALKLPAGARRMLEVLARFHPSVLSIGQVASLAQIKKRGGTWGTYVSLLRTNGLIRVDGKQMSVTDAGLDAIDYVPQSPVTPDEVLNMWRDRLAAGANRMLQVLVDINPAWITKEELGERAEVALAGGSFGTYLSMLRTTGLAEVDGQKVRAGEALMLGG